MQLLFSISKFNPLEYLIYIFDKREEGTQNKRQLNEKVIN